MFFDFVDMFQSLKQQFAYLNSKDSLTTNNINEINVDLEFVDLQEDIDDAFFEYEAMQKTVNDVFASSHAMKTRDDYQE